MQGEQKLSFNLGCELRARPCSKLLNSQFAANF
jgi:hypothetical protein